MRLLLLIALLTLSCFSQDLFAQDNACQNCPTTRDFDNVKFIMFHDSVVIRDTIRDTVFVGSSSIQELSEKLNLSYTDFIENFLKYVKEQKSIDTIDMQYDDFMKDYVAKIYSEVYQGQYIYQTYWIDQVEQKIKSNKQNHPDLTLLPDTAILQFVFIQQGEFLTNNFLKTKNEQIRVMEKILQDISNLPLRSDTKVAINFYFPDYDFSDKRSLFQFAKSVSLVLDSIKVQELRKVKLFFSFNEANVDEYSSYLIGLYDMIDSVYGVDLASGNRTVLKKEDINSFLKIRNQFLFARFEIDNFPDVKANDISYETIGKLMNTDYTEEWEMYFIAILAILMLLLVCIICYLTIPIFCNYINQNYLYAFAGVIILGAEVVILLIYMIEEIGSQTKIITLKDIILFPILLVFILPLLINFFKRKDIP